MEVVPERPVELAHERRVELAHEGPVELAHEGSVELAHERPVEPSSDPAARWSSIREATGVSGARRLPQTDASVTSGRADEDRLHPSNADPRDPQPAPRYPPSPPPVEDAPGWPVAPTANPFGVPLAPPVTDEAKDAPASGLSSEDPWRTAAPPPDVARIWKVMQGESAGDTPRRGSSAPDAEPPPPPPTRPGREAVAVAERLQNPNIEPPPPHPDGDTPRWSSSMSLTEEAGPSYATTPSPWPELDDQSFATATRRQSAVAADTARRARLAAEQRGE